MTDELKAYAMANYEAGGHWIAETYTLANYQADIDAAGGDIEAAKAQMKKDWLFLNMREAEAGDF